MTETGRELRCSVVRSAAGQPELRCDGQFAEQKPHSGVVVDCRIGRSCVVVYRWRANATFLLNGLNLP